MIEQNLVDKEIITNFQTNYFAHYMKEYVDDSFYSTIKEEIQKNDWELHKKYIKEGHNPNEIAKLLRNDEIEKLQEISSQQNFDFNQTIEPSLYERCSFINQRNVTLIDYAAFFSAVKCFKYLLVNGSNFQNAGKYAVAGGNTEIVHLCEQNGSSFNGAYEAAIKYHRNDIFRYIYENELENLAESEKQNITSFQQYRNQRNQQPNNENQNNETTNTITKIASKYTNLCNMCGNIEILLFLEEEGIKIDDQIINEAAYFGNLYLVQHYLNNHQPPKDIFSYSTQAGNIELVKYVLGLGGIDINVANIHKNYLKFILRI